MAALRVSRYLLHIHQRRWTSRKYAKFFKSSVQTDRKSNLAYQLNFVSQHV